MKLFLVIFLACAAPAAAQYPYNLYGSGGYFDSNNQQRRLEAYQQQNHHDDTIRRLDQLQRQQQELLRPSRERWNGFYR